MFTGSLVTGREECDQSSRASHGYYVVKSRCQGTEEVETEEDDQAQEESVVIEDAEMRGFVLSDFVFPAENSLIAFIPRNLSISELLSNLAVDGLFPFLSQFMFGYELNTGISHGQKIGRDRCHSGEEDRVRN